MTDSDEGRLFEAMEAMRGELRAIEGKVGAIEGKVGAIGGKVGAIEDYLRGQEEERTLTEERARAAEDARQQLIEELRQQGIPLPGTVDTPLTGGRSAVAGLLEDVLGVLTTAAGTRGGMGIIAAILAAALAALGVSASELEHLVDDDAPPTRARPRPEPAPDPDTASPGVPQPLP